MSWSQKALDTVTGQNFQRQDLSPVITLDDGPTRPALKAMKHIPATAQIHYWIEQNLIKPGSGAASYPEGARPPVDSVAPQRLTNQTCNTGKTASVTDNLAAVWTGAGSYRLADGEEERMLQEAINYQTTLKTIEVMNEMEFMHVSGDSSNPQGTTGAGSFPGGQCDGLIKWATASGYVNTTGGTTTTPVNFTETFVKTTMRDIAKKYPTYLPNRMLIPPELMTDVNAFIGGGAGRPIFQPITVASEGYTAGQRVAFYQTGFGVVEVVEEPNLSPAYNPTLPQMAVILYNTELIKQADLIKLGAEPLARIGTSVERMVTCVYSQEHRAANHVGIIPNVKSAF